MDARSMLDLINRGKTDALAAILKNQVARGEDVFDLGGLVGSVGKTRAPNPESLAGACGIAPGGKVVKPFVVASRGQLAAATAQAIDTDLYDVFDAANVDFIASDNQFPYRVDVEEIYVVLTGNIAASYIETDAVLSSMYFIESDQTGELARWPLYKLGYSLGRAGLATSGAVSALTVMPTKGVPWVRTYDVRGTYSLALRTTKAFTPAAAVDISVIMPGRR